MTMQPTEVRSMRFKNYFLFFSAWYFAFQIVAMLATFNPFPILTNTLFLLATKFWDWAIPLAGEHLFHLALVMKPKGGGDATYNYIQLLLEIPLAAFLAFTLLIVTQRRQPRELDYYLRVAVRYFLVYVMFLYGFYKIVKLQFPAPGLLRLTETYGDSSPMGLAWTFLGYSNGYNYFLGSAEIMAGILMLFRRTTLLGALLTMIVMINVAAMNFAYDIPVKLFSSNLIIMAAFLAAPDAGRMYHFFFLNYAVTPMAVSKSHTIRWKSIPQRSLKAIAIVWILYSTLWKANGLRSKYDGSVSRSPLYGIYNVESFFSGNKELPPLTTDPLRWKQMIIEQPGIVMIKGMNDSARRMRLEVDTESRTVAVTPFDYINRGYNFHYTRPDKEHLLLEGENDTSSVRILFSRYDESRFRLMNTGFHWVNEYPDNQ